MRASSIAFALAVAASVPGVAAAQDGGTTTVVAPFAGRGSRAAERLVGRAIRQDTDVVSRRRVISAARRAGVEGTEPAGVPELAEALAADLVVQGQVSGSRRRQRVVLLVRGADGVELARAEAELRRGARGMRAFGSAVQAVFSEALAAREASLAPEPEPEPEPVPVMVDPEEEEEEEPSDAPEDGLAIFTALVGLSVRSRLGTVDLLDGRQRRYESGPYPELALAVEARPLALDAGLGRGLYLRGAFAHSVGLGSQSEDGTVQVDTNFLRFGVDAGWLAPLGDIVELGVGLGFSYDGYFLGMNNVMPSAEYMGIRPALRGRVRFLQETLVLDFEVAYRAVLATGAIRDAFGAEGDSHGVDVGLQLGGNLHLAAELGFTWAVRFDYIGYFHSFGGASTDVPGTSGEEVGLLGTFLVGWSFR